MPVHHDITPWRQFILAIKVFHQYLYFLKTMKGMKAYETIDERMSKQVFDKQNMCLISIGQSTRPKNETKNGCQENLSFHSKN